MGGPRRRRIAALLVPLLLAAGCSKPSAPPIALDGSPRRPNAEGVVTEVTFDKLTLDGSRTFRVHPKLQCFDSATLRTVPLLQRKGTYVQLGVAGETVRWLAGYSAVVELPGQPAMAFHVGTVVRSEAGEIVFRDGSVLKVAPGVQPAPAGAVARADIDVARHAVIALAPG